MRTLKAVIAALSLVCVSLLSAESVPAATYVYVSNAHDGNIGLYTLASDGTLKPADMVDAGGKPGTPMSVDPDKQDPFAAVRAKPFTAVSYSLDRKSGKLKEVGRGPLA